MTEHIWKGKEVRTLGDLVDAIAALESREEAQEFIAGYRQVEQHADVNAGYVTGYLDRSDAERLREWMGTPHPVFGMKSPDAPTAFAAGLQAALDRQRRRDPR